MQNIDTLYKQARQLYLDGRYDEAFPLLTEAAEGGHAGAQCLLGYCYFHGQGTAQNESQAVLQFMAAAEGGDADAQCRLGWCYFTAYGGLAQHFDRAAALFTKAAAQGHPAAQDNLGYCYEKGRGVQKDLAAAIEWYKRAAAQGNQSARRSLERLGQV